MSTLSATTEQIQPTLLTRLAAHAQRTGKTVNALLQELLDEREAVPYPPDARSVATRVPLDDWSRELRAWAASHPVSTVVADDSRASIYEGQGE